MFQQINKAKEAKIIAVEYFNIKLQEYMYSILKIWSTKILSETKSVNINHTILACGKAYSILLLLSQIH